MHYTALQYLSDIEIKNTTYYKYTRTKEQTDKTNLGFGYELSEREIQKDKKCKYKTPHTLLADKLHYSFPHDDDEKCQIQLH